MILSSSSTTAVAATIAENITKAFNIINNNDSNTGSNSMTSTTISFVIQGILQLIEVRKQFFETTVEPILISWLGPLEDDMTNDTSLQEAMISPCLLDCNVTNSHEELQQYYYHYDEQEQYQDYYSYNEDMVIDPASARRRLGFLPSYVYQTTNSTSSLFSETSMSFSALSMLFLTLSCVFLVFLSCFYHNQKTSPLFISPRRHRLPKLVPPPLPVDGYFSWVKICFYLSDEEIINRIGYDSLIFIRFHRLALRCIVKMSVFSFIVLLPLNYTGGGHANAQDLKEYMDSLFFTDFLRFTMANVKAGSPRLWVHCFAAYLLTAIVVRELLVEYENFNSIRHRYLLSREPHLRTVLVTNIPRHLRSASKVTNYFKHVYPDAVKSVNICQNLIHLEQLIKQRTSVLHKIEKELLLLCRNEKKKLLYEQQQKSLWTKAKSISEKIIQDDSSYCCCGGGDNDTSCCRTFLSYCCCCCGGSNHQSNHVGGDDNPSNSISSICCGIGLLAGTQERLTRLYAKLEELNNDIETEQHRRRRVMKMLDRMEAGEGSNDIDYVLATPFVVTDNTMHRRVLGLQPLPGAATATLVSPQQYQPPAGRGIGVENGNPIGGVRRNNTNNSLVPESIPEGNENVDDWNGTGEVGGGGVDTARSTYHNDSSNRVRSRSPRNNNDDNNDKNLDEFEHDGIMKSNNNNDIPDLKKKRKTFAKARRAIKRYGRLKQGWNLLAKPIHNPVVDVDRNDDNRNNKIEDHINEVTDKAFVVMRTFTAATIAIQSMHSSKPGSMHVQTAPEPRDILWENIYMSKGARRTRSYLGEFFVLLIITFYIVPVAMIALLVSEQALVSSSPKLAQLQQASAFFSAAIALVQPLCVVGLQQLLPPLFMAIGRVEGITSFSEVQMRAFSRYFLFQVLNVFLVTTIAGSIFDTIAAIVENPELAFEMLGNSLPRMSSFFITFVTIKTFLGLGFELVRTMALVQATARYILFPNATLRAKRMPLAAMRAIDDPGWFPFHKILAQDMLVVVISVVFAVVAPLVTIPCALFCLCARIMWTHHHLYVYESVFESGGQFWPKIFRRFVFGLIIAQMTITGQFILKEARHEAYATIVLMFLTYFFLRSTRARYDATSSTLPLEVATVMDISLNQDEVIDDRQHHTPNSRHYAAESTGRFVAVSPRQQDPIGGTYIGQHDPFKKAYLQPALRANPRARPEQPFPAAQLGREEIYHNTLHNHDGSGSDCTSIEGGRNDARATVRLKLMNQNDRRLINRWWYDQLQRAGPQNHFLILIGEECGTLTLSGPSSSVGSAELHDHPTLTNSHSFV